MMIGAQISATIKIASSMAAWADIRIWESITVLRRLTRGQAFRSVHSDEGERIMTDLRMTDCTTKTTQNTKRMWAAPKANMVVSSPDDIELTNFTGMQVLDGVAFESS